MKTIGLLFILLFCQCKLFSQDFYSSIDPSVKIIEPILYLEDTKNLIDISEEYISNNISNVKVIYKNNTVYISWDVCDDSTNSYFIVKKHSIDESFYKTVGFRKNVPCNPHVNLSYSISEENISLDKSYYYKLYKQLPNYEVIHIITIILPKQTKNEQLSKSN